MSTIIDAIANGRLEEVQKLIVEYQAYLGVDLCFQNFDREINDLSSFYASPGRLFLGLSDNDEAVGCIGFHPLAGTKEDVAELKRLYVKPGNRSTGLGLQLVNAAMDAAREEGFASICLDTLPTLKTAVRMYRRLGFEDIEPYYDNPIAGILWLSKNLN